MGVARNQLCSSVFVNSLFILDCSNLIHPEMSGYLNIDLERKVSITVDTYLGVLKYY